MGWAAAVVSAAATVASVVIGVQGAKREGVRQQAVAETNARGAEFDASISLQNAAILEENARLTDAEAAAAERSGAFTSDQRRNQARVALATQRARLAAMGVDVNSGSPLDVQSETVTNAAIDLGVLAEETGLNASRARSQSGIYRAQAGSERQRASFLVDEAGFTRATGAAARAAGQIGATSSVITGVGRLADRYDSYRSPAR